jgi:tetratricopeptide (TPR) repeat protein
MCACQGRNSKKYHCTFIWVKLLIVLALLPLVVGTPTTVQYSQWLARGDALRERKEYSAALAMYNQAHQLAPELAVPLVRTGEVYLAQQRYALAIGVLQTALSLQGSKAEALAKLAEAYSGQGEWLSASNAAREALALAPELRETRLLLGRAYLRREKYEEAQQVFEDALLRYPGDPTAHYYLGLLAATKDPESARPHLQATIAAQPGSALATQAGSALEGFRESSATDDPALAAARLGLTYLQLDELQLAGLAFAKAIDAAPDYAEAYAYLGHVKAQLGQPALDLLQHALRLQPDLVLGHYFLGSYYRAQGLDSLAEEEFWTALHRDPRNAALCSEMALIYLERGDYTTAEEWMVAAVERAPRDPAFQLLLARFYVDHAYRVKEKGIEAARRAVELAPQSAEAHDLLGWAYFLNGDLSLAEESLRRALELDGELAAAHYHLGALLEARGKRAEARVAYQRAADLDTTGLYRERAERALSRSR